jgi:hypothetical protein
LRSEEVEVKEENRRSLSKSLKSQKKAKTRDTTETKMVVVKMNGLHPCVVT